MLRAADGLFAERGYAGTRLDDVAAAAGVTKPIVYRHFESKKAPATDEINKGAIKAAREAVAALEDGAKG